MKIIKYRYAFLFFFYFFAHNTEIYAWDMGVKVGGSFQSFYLDGKGQGKETSNFGFQTSLFFEFLPHERVLLLADVGFSYYPNEFYNPWVSGTLGFVIYPEYLPFIGITLKEGFYNKIFSDTNRWITGIYLSAGSKIFIEGPHSLWLFFDYLVFQSLYKTYNSSNATFSLAYSYSFGSAPKNP